jgi:hypothetical protein
MCKKVFMSPSLLQEDRNAKRVPQTLMQSLNVDVPDTSSPIQLYKIRGILRANWAPALVYEQFAVV